MEFLFSRRLLLAIPPSKILMTTELDPFAGLPAPISAALVARGFTELTAVQKAVVEAES